MLAADPLATSLQAWPVALFLRWSTLGMCHDLDNAVTEINNSDAGAGAA